MEEPAGNFTSAADCDLLLKRLQVLLYGRNVSRISSIFKILSKLRGLVCRVALGFVNLSQNKKDPRLAVVLVNISSTQCALFRLRKIAHMQICGGMVLIYDRILRRIELECAGA